MKFFDKPNCSKTDRKKKIPRIFKKNKIDKEQGENMSGLGPAACWLAHKRIESWSRLAKERVGAVRKSTDKSTDGKPSTSSVASSSGSMNMSIDSNNDSFASTEVKMK